MLIFSYSPLEVGVETIKISRLSLFGVDSTLWTFFLVLTTD